MKWRQNPSRHLMKPIHHQRYLMSCLVYMFLRKTFLTPNCILPDFWVTIITKRKYLERVRLDSTSPTLVYHSPILNLFSLNRCYLPTETTHSNSDLATTLVRAGSPLKKRLNKSSKTHILSWQTSYPSTEPAKANVISLRTKLKDEGTRFPVTPKGVGSVYRMGFPSRGSVNPEAFCMTTT